MDKENFFQEVKAGLCEGNNNYKFCASCNVTIIGRRAENKMSSETSFGEIVFSDTPPKIIMKRLGWPYSYDEDTIFSTDNSCFIYNPKEKSVIITSVLKHPKNSYGSIIELCNIKKI